MSDLERDELVLAAREIAPLLRANSDRAERDSRLPDDSVHALAGAGMFRMAVPRAYGGLAVEVSTALEVAAELGRACPASAWITVLSLGAQHIAAAFDDAVHDELWADRSDGSFCGSFTGFDLTVRKVDGGQIVSGRWPWASGSNHASWAALSMPVAGDEDSAGPGIALVPMTDLAIDHTWDMAGMRGSGSDTVVADNVFVPTPRIRPLGELFAGGRTGLEPLYRVPLGSMSITLMGPILGATQEVLDLTMQSLAKGKPMSGSIYSRAADSPSIQANLAEAASLIDSARMHLFRSADYLDRTAAAGEPFEMVERARVRMDSGYASKRLREAMQLLMNAGGASTFARTNVVQRYWRDIETAARQPTIGTDLGREIYGRALVGATQQVAQLI